MTQEARLRELLQGGLDWEVDRFFLGGGQGLSRGNFGIKGICPEIPPPTKVMFDRTMTPYGLLLHDPLKHPKGRPSAEYEVAALGFAYDEGVMDVLQIQGASKRYRHNRSFAFSPALLSNAIKLAREAGLDAVTMPMCVDIEGYDPERCEAFVARYDRNAQAQGMKYSRERERFVLDL